MTGHETSIDVYHEDGQQKVERMDTPVYITEGMYARFLTTPDQSKSYSYSELHAGDILLITKLDYADNQLHSITLKDHPRNADEKNQSRTFQFLFDTFHEHFEIVSKVDGQAIRTEELNALNKTIGFKKEEFSDLETNPEKLQAISFAIYSRRISSPQAPVSLQVTNVVDLLGSANASEQIAQYSATANMAKDLAQIQMQYLQDLQKEILDLSKKVMPYVVEHMSAGIASVEEQRTKFQQLNDSVASMEMYNGVGVEVHTIREGKPAASDIPLTLTQERLWADVELSYFEAQTAEKMDITSLGGDFFSALAQNEALVNQIFPTERCVCIMATRERAVEDLCKDQDQMFKMMVDEKNREAFLLVRNGENIHAVFSPIGTHLVAKNLFPSRNSLDRHFFKFGGDIQITPDSLDYARATQDADRETLHYKRFLILIAGLQHRLNLFGQFYPEQQVFNIFNIAFQEKYFNYIHDGDGEGLLSDGNAQSLIDWVLLKNRSLRKGSVLICNNRAMTFREIASGCFRYSYGWTRDNNYRQVKDPIHAYSVVTCQQNKDGEFFVKIQCSNEHYIDTFEKEPRITDTVYLIPEGKSGIHYSAGHVNRIPYLVLDKVSVEELEYYCSQRRFRKQYMAYMELFKEAKSFLLKAQSDASTDFGYYRNAIDHIADKDQSLKDHQIATLISDASNFFVGSNKQKSALAYLHSQISLNYAKKNKQLLISLAQKYVNGSRMLPEGVRPIASTIDTKGNIFVYTNLPESEQLNQLRPNIWMNRYSLVEKRNVKQLELLEENGKVSFDTYRRDERLLLVIDEELYNSYMSHTSWSSQKVAHSGGVEVCKTGEFHTYTDKQKMLDAEKYSIDLIHKIVSNTVGRFDVERLYNLIERCDDGAIGLFVGFASKDYTRPIKLFIHQGQDWLKRLYNRYQENPGVGLLEQDNSSLALYVDDFNWPDDWDLKTLLRERGYDRGNYNTPYSSRSVGYALEQFCIKESKKISYSSLTEGMDTLLSVDEWLGNVNMIHPIVRLGTMQARYYVCKKGEHTYFDTHTITIVSESDKLEDLKNKVANNFEILKSKRDLQRERVEMVFHIKDEFVIHPEDYRGLITNSYSHHSDVRYSTMIWSNRHQCYLNDGHEHFLD